MILSGGPASVYEAGSPHPDPALWSGGIPILGICYGLHLMAEALGGEVVSFERKEFGPAVVSVIAQEGLFAGIEPEQSVWMSHGDSIERLPNGFRPTARTDSTPYAAVANPERKMHGIQFHPEVVHTKSGRDILRNFVVGIAGARQTWTAANFIASNVEEIRRRVDEHSRATGTDGKVLCALSGGVDSAVAATLVHRAVGDRLICVHVDNGMMRKNETELLQKTFDQLGVRVIVVDARDRFLRKLAGITDPEQKRHAIGNEFIRVFEEEAAKLGQIAFLTQGTLYPDVVESGGGTGTANIKSHHNVGGLPDDLQFKLIEPLRMLFKDEVRKVGLELGVPEAIVWRQPFPGPGLGIRIVGEVTAERLSILRAADAIAREELTAAGLDRDIWQCPVVLLAGVRSVGVQGDGRSYGHPIVLRPVSSEDAMTADWTRVPYDVLAKISTRITNEVPEVNRVVLDVTSKPPGTIEWE